MSYEQKLPRIRKRSRGQIVAAICLGLVAAVVLAAVLFTYFRPDAAPVSTRKISTRLATGGAVPLNLPPPDLLRPITPEQAVEENKTRAFSGRPDSAPAAFKLNADDMSHGRALECLTQAVYYEAASEGADGQRAVAQVVLNRMRHPAYPSSVCGVVYQGSERATGCQFTFTCDGSLARAPVPSLWKQARSVAQQALAGKVFAPVGHATHYHADYVLPYWADSLDKMLQIGRHIFYRLKGGLGASRAFSQRYSGHEVEPLLSTTFEVAMEAVEKAGQQLTAPIEESPNQAPVGELVGATMPKPELLADATQGSLLLDGDAPRAAERTSTSRPKVSEACKDSGGSAHLRPLSANDTRSRQDGAGC
jgi:spore germination cell wall hydrolase CwlJ-like protein